jgi:hypothetical protein
MANTYKKLQTVTVGSGGSSSITFSNIPQTYTDLVVKFSARDSADTGISGGLLTLNGNTSTSYSRMLLRGSGSGTPISTSGTNGTNLGGMANTDTSNATSTFGNSELYIPNYTSSNYKSISFDGTQEDNSASTNVAQSFIAGLWSNTSAITSITLTAPVGNWTQYSTFTLYGVYAGAATPSTPTIASATDLGGGTAQVTISSPAAIPYTVTSSPGGITATGMSPINISGLSPQTSYTFTAQAVAPWGTSAASSDSSSVSMYNGMTALATVTVGSGGAANVTFSSIPSGYSHLQLRAFARADNSGTDSRPSLQINGDTGANYSNHHIYFEGTSPASQGFTSNNVIDRLGYMPAAGSLSSTFAVFIMDFLDYSNTSKYKTIRSLNGHDENTVGRYSSYASGVWMSTSAISTLTFTVAGGGNFVQYTNFALYGVK